MRTSLEEKKGFSTDRRLGRAASVLSTAAKDFIRENGPQWAAAIAYYSLLSVFPLLLATVSIAAFFVNPDWVINQITQLMGEFLPQGERRIEEIVRGAFDARGGVSIISVLLLLWTGTRVFGVLTRALNIAFDEAEKYGFFKRHLVELLMVITLGLLFILALLSRFAIQFLWNRFLGMPEGQNIGLFILQLLIPGLLLFSVFYLVYRYVPNREVDSRAALAGAIFTTLVILIARPLFLGYLNRFAEYNLIYGSLAILVILIIWTWIMAMIILFGGQITSEVQLHLINNENREGQERP